MDTFSDNTKTLIAISPKSGTELHYETIIESIDPSGGLKDFDAIVTMAGGRLKNHRPQEPVEITFEGYAVEIGTDTGTQGKGFYSLLHPSNTDVTQPLKYTNDRERKAHRVVIMTTADLSASSATSISSATHKAKRWTFLEGEFTNVEATNTDHVWTYSITYKVLPFDKSGNKNLEYESTDGTVALPAISAYT
jgi:hypothetical protein